MTTKHTPGPWNPLAAFNMRHFFIRGEFEVVAQVYDNAANARLIAAAPDLLEALEQCEGYISFDVNAGHGGRDLLRTVRAALTKARGEG